MEEQTIEFRRTRTTEGKWKNHNKPYIKLELPRGQFIVFKPVAKLLEAKSKDAVMFAFSKQNKHGYIYKEEPEDDSYYLSNSKREYYRFTSKELGKYFAEIFELPEGKKSFYFEVESFPNQKGQYRFTLAN